MYCEPERIVSEIVFRRGRVKNASSEMQCEQGKTEKRDRIHNRSEEGGDRVGEKFIRGRRLRKAI